MLSKLTNVIRSQKEKVADAENEAKFKNAKDDGANLH